MIVFGIGLICINLIIITVGIPLAVYFERQECASPSPLLIDKPPKEGGYFTVKSQLKLSSLPVGSVIPESDFSTVNPDGIFTQLEYHEESREGRAPYEVKPGVFTIFKSSAGFVLEKTSFVNDSILEEFADTQEVESKIDCFFNNLATYKKLGFEVAKRGMLLYGPAGTGKTTNINKASKKYVADGKTVIIVWPTDKYEAFEVKDFIKTFTYKGVEKMIFVLEDLGGVEIEGQRVRSDSSLLSLLDNQEKTFIIPVMMIATTNHPEMFLANLTNRPNRFDDKIKVGFPKPEARVGLLKFFAKDHLVVPDSAADFLFSNKCKDFSPAHIREIVVRSMIYSKEVTVVLQEMVQEIENFKKDFAEKSSGGMGFGA
jgi:hypothetical protein